MALRIPGILSVLSYYIGVRFLPTQTIQKKTNILASGCFMEMFRCIQVSVLSSGHVRVVISEHKTSASQICM